MTISYMLSVVIMYICSGLAAILNAKFLPAAITHVTHVHRITVSWFSVDCSVQYSSVTVACKGLQLLWKIAIFLRPEVRRWPLDIGGTVDSP